MNLIRVLWTSSRSRSILTGRERDADAENWTTVKPRPANERRKRRGAGGLADAGRWLEMCRGWIFRDRKGERGVILVWFYSVEGWFRSRRVRKGSRIRPFSPFSPSNVARVHDVIGISSLLNFFFQNGWLIWNFREARNFISKFHLI